jgi:hypothetical protein
VCRASSDGNTLANNVAAEGSGVYADGEDQSAHLSNNLILGTPGSSVLDCGDFSDLAPPVVVTTLSAAAPPMPVCATRCCAPTVKMPELDAYWRLRGPGAGSMAATTAPAPSVDLAGGAACATAMVTGRRTSTSELSSTPEPVGIDRARRQSEVFRA